MLEVDIHIDGALLFRRFCAWSAGVWGAELRAQKFWPKANYSDLDAHAQSLPLEKPGFFK